MKVLVTVPQSRHTEGPVMMQRISERADEEEKHLSIVEDVTR